MAGTMHAPRATLEDRFENAANGLLFLLIAALALPSGIPEYAAIVVLGALMLAVNVARMKAGIRMRWFSITVGAWAVIGGVGALAGLKVDAFALFFLVLGLVALGAAAFRSH